jgi:hypothetical protein
MRYIATISKSRTDRKLLTFVAPYRFGRSRYRWKALSIPIPTSYRTSRRDFGNTSKYSRKVERCMAFFGIPGSFLVLITFFLVSQIKLIASL